MLLSLLSIAPQGFRPSPSAHQGAGIAPPLPCPQAAQAPSSRGPVPPDHHSLVSSPHRPDDSPQVHKDPQGPEDMERTGLGSKAGWLTRSRADREEPRPPPALHPVVHKLRAAGGFWEQRGLHTRRASKARAWTGLALAKSCGPCRRQAEPAWCCLPEAPHRCGNTHGPEWRVRFKSSESGPGHLALGSL